MFLLSQIVLDYTHYLEGREGMGKTGKMGEIFILARYRVHFSTEHENLVKDPSSNKSIVLYERWIKTN